LPNNNLKKWTPRGRTPSWFSLPSWPHLLCLWKLKWRKRILSLSYLDLKRMVMVKSLRLKPLRFPMKQVMML
ncbi:unnamed protein product, partial [Durusdinium trenchii]